MNFYKPIISEKSTYEVHPRSIQFHLKKRGEKIVGAGDCSGKSKSKVASVDFVEAWPHLLNDKSLEVNKYDISVDWSHFEDME